MFLDKLYEIKRVDTLLVRVVEQRKIFRFQLAQLRAREWRLDIRGHRLVYDQSKEVVARTSRNAALDRTTGNLFDLYTLILTQTAPFSAQLVDGLPISVD